MCVRAASTGHASIGHLLMVAEQVSDSRGGRNTLHAANNTPKRSRGVSQSNVLRGRSLSSSATEQTSN